MASRASEWQRFASQANSHYQSMPYRGRSAHSSSSGQTQDSQLSKDSTPPTWSQWSELKLRVKGIPRNLSIVDLHTFFSKYGHLTYIKVEDAWSGKVLLNFSPPPSKEFWTQMPFVMHCPRMGQRHNLHGELAFIRQEKVSSPLDRHTQFPSKMVSDATNFFVSSTDVPCRVSTPRL